MATPTEAEAALRAAQLHLVEVERRLASASESHQLAQREAKRAARDLSEARIHAQRTVGTLSSGGFVPAPPSVSEARDRASTASAVLSAREAEVRAARRDVERAQQEIENARRAVWDEAGGPQAYARVMRDEAQRLGQAAAECRREAEQAEQYRGPEITDLRLLNQIQAEVMRTGRSTTLEQISRGEQPRP